MDIYDNNINVLTNYIADGSKGCNSNAVGVELEHFVIDKTAIVCRISTVLKI